MGAEEMSDVIVASTTDDQTAVNAAAGGKPQDAELPPEKAAPTGDEKVESKEPEVKAEPEKKEDKPVPRGVDKRIGKLTAQLTAAQQEIEKLKNQPKSEEKKEEPAVPTE